MTPAVLLATGGRDFVGGPEHNAFLDAIQREHRLEVLIHGGATGADTFADDWGWHLAHPKPAVWPIPAPWRVGRGAGPRRNEFMLRVLLDYARSFDAEPIVVAFPGGRGTAHMVKVARAKGVRVEVYALALREGSG